MAKNILNCVIKDWQDDQFDLKNIDPTAPSNISKHVKQLHDVWKAVNSKVNVHPNANETVNQFFKKAERIGNIVGAVSYDKAFYNKMMSRVNYGVFGKLKHLADRVTKGNVVEYLARMDRQSRGYILEQIASLEVANKAKSLNKALNQVYKRHKIANVDKATMAYYLTEISQQPYLIQYSGGANLAAQKFLMNRQDQIMNWLQSKGLDMSEIKSLTNLSDEVVQAEYEIAAIGAKTGVDLTPLLGSGVMNRILTPQANRVLKMLDNLGEDIPELASITTKPSEWLKNSRNYNVLIPSDVDTIDYLFRNSGVYNRINNTTDDALKRLLGNRKINSIQDVMTSGNDPIIHEAFINQLSSSEFDFMVESGLMAKIPIDTPTLYQRIADHYKLPFEGVEEMFIYNPEEAAKIYTSQLEELAADEGKIWGLIDGANRGFGVPRSIADADPDTYGKFKPLSDMLPGRVKERIQNQDILDQLDNTLVNPMVANQWRAMTEVLTNPTKMAWLGDMLTTTRRLSQAMMLGTVQWLGRNVVGNAAILESLGVHLHDFTGHFTKMVAGQTWDMAKGKVFDYSKHLSDKPTLYGGKSMRDLYKAGIRKGQLSAWSALGKAGSATEFTIKGSRETFKQLLWIRKNYPEIFPQELLKGGIKGVEALANSSFYKYLSFGNNISDNAAKLALAQQLMNPHRLTRKAGMGALDVLPTIKDMDEAWDWVSKHWMQFDDLPKNSAWYDTLNSSQPFFGYMYKNFQQTGRMLMENPNRFGSYFKLAQMQQDEFKEDNPMANYLKQSEWNIDQLSQLPFKIPAELSGTGKDEFFEYSIGRLIPFFEPFDTMNEVLDFFGIFNSSKTPSERGDNPFKDRESKIRKFLDDSRVVFDNPISAVAEIAARWEEEFNELEDRQYKKQLFGVEMSPTAYAAITSTLPFSRSFDRLFQYTPLAGEAPDLNEQTREYNPGKPSWTGATPTRPTRGQQPKAFVGTAVMDALGVAPNYIDQYYQMYGKIGELRYLMKRAESELKSYRYRFAEATDKEEVARLQDQYKKHIQWAYMMRLEWDIIQTWRKDKGLTSRQALDHIKRENIKIDRLLPREEIQRIAEQNWQKYDNEYMNAFEEPRK